MKCLSIIIPHYNTPALLEKLLITIPKNDEIEVIVVDDKSDKGVEKYNELVLSRKHNHITFLSNETGTKGAGAARSIGLKRSSGKWLLFADADDYFVDGFYEKVKKYFNTDHDVVFFKMTSCYLDTGVIAERHVVCNSLVEKYLLANDEGSEAALRYLHITPCAKLIKKQFIDDNNIDFDEVIVADDRIFSVKVGHLMKNFVIDENIVYCITRGRGTLTMNTGEHIFDTRLEVFIDYYHYLNERLTKEQFRALNIFGLGLLVDVLRYRLGFKKFFWVVAELKKNEVQIINGQLLNPFFVFKKGFGYMKRCLNEKKYMRKKEQEI